MGKTKKAVRLDTRHKPPQIKQEDFNAFLRKFLGLTTKKGMMLPPTNAEKALIVGKIKEPKKPKKAIIPEVIKMKKK